MKLRFSGRHAEAPSDLPQPVWRTSGASKQVYFILANRHGPLTDGPEDGPGASGDRPRRAAVIVHALHPLDPDKRADAASHRVERTEEQIVYHPNIHHGRGPDLPRRLVQDEMGECDVWGRQSDDRTDRRDQRGVRQSRSGSVLHPISRRTEYSRRRAGPILGVIASRDAITYANSWPRDSKWCPI